VSPPPPALFSYATSVCKAVPFQFVPPYTGILRQSSTAARAYRLLSRERLAPASREPSRARQDARAKASMLTLMSCTARTDKLLTNRSVPRKSQHNGALRTELV
jgi:hypothetical protein